MNDTELARLIREHAYLEGDFLLRSGKRSRYYLDKYRFETRPDVLGPIGERLGARALEGVFEPGEEVCLVEDVVTSCGAAAEAIDVLREAGLQCRVAICVVDREEGGVDALARKAVRLHALFRASDVLQA